jgi:CheY-like chemotaxis protein
MITLLIIDGDADDVQIFSEAVQEIDKTIDCLSANTGEAALQLLKDGIVKADFIFLDLNMPRMSGTQFLIKETRI